MERLVLNTPSKGRGPLGDITPFLAFVLFFLVFMAVLVLLAVGWYFADRPSFLRVAGKLTRASGYERVVTPTYDNSFSNFEFRRNTTALSVDRTKLQVVIPELAVAKKIPEELLWAIVAVETDPNAGVALPVRPGKNEPGEGGEDFEVRALKNFASFVEQFGGDYRSALAAYHTGSTIKKATGSETERYVGKVLEQYQRALRKKSGG